MQKTTAFTLLFSVLVVALTAEVLAGNSFRDGWSSVLSPSDVLQDSGSIGTPATDSANTSGVTVVPAVPDASGTLSDVATAPEVATPLVNPSAPNVPSSTSDASGSAVPSFSLPSSIASASPSSLPSSAPALTPSSSSVQGSSGEVAAFMQDTSFALASVTSENLKSFGFTTMHLERVGAEGLLYQLLDLSDLVNLSKIRFHLTDGKSVYGVISEYRAADAARAKEVYAALKQKASAFHPEATVNETSQFGSASFYLNDTKRMGTAFLTVLSDTHVYGFAYPKASHAFFSKLVNFLAKRP